MHDNILCSLHGDGLKVCFFLKLFMCSKNPNVILNLILNLISTSSVNSLDAKSHILYGHSGCRSNAPLIHSILVAMVIIIGWTTHLLYFCCNGYCYYWHGWCFSYYCHSYYYHCHGWCLRCHVVNWFKEEVPFACQSFWQTCCRSIYN